MYYFTNNSFGDAVADAGQHTNPTARRTVAVEMSRK